MEIGVYEPEERLHEHIIFPALHLSLLEKVARRLADRNPSLGSTANFQNLIDTSTLEAIITESKLRNLWDGFTHFRIFTSGILGIR